MSIESIAQALTEGSLPPWQVERAFEEHGARRFHMAAETRRAFLEQESGVRFEQLAVPEEPWRTLADCRSCGLVYDLVAWDRRRRCSVCGSDVEARDEPPQALVASYIGGIEDFYSYAGVLEVTGDIERRFLNVLQYGTGLGPVGATRGCFLASRLGGVEIAVGEKSRALRALCFDYDSESRRDQAWQVMLAKHDDISTAIRPHLEPWQGVLAMVEPLRTSEGRQHRLYVTFIADFINHRGHHAVSKAVGAVKPLCERLLAEASCAPLHAFIAQGYDGDLKPSHRNLRGRSALASVTAPLDVVRTVCKVEPATLLRFIRIDAQGAQKLGHVGHTGMGGEIVPACYKATKINPHSPLVSATEAIHADISDGDFHYEVAMPNIEAGVLSTTEGLIPPVGREMIEVIGLRDSRDFAAWCAGLVLAAELNLSVEIAREQLYRAANE
jgi:hydroxymethylglutaryl-CoA reductase